MKRKNDTAEKPKPRKAQSEDEKAARRKIADHKAAKAVEDKRIMGVFGPLLRAARKAKGVSRLVLANHLGFLKAAIVGYYETGDRTPDWPTVCALAKELGVDVAFFLGEEGPTWHVLNNKKGADVYITHRNLAMQTRLVGDEEDRRWKGAVRQFGVRLPLRVMNRAYLDAHLKEVANEAKGAFEEIWLKHGKAVREERLKWKGTDRAHSLFESVHSLMRVSDFQRLLLLTPPYDALGCEPLYARSFLEGELRTLVEEGYNFHLVPDDVANGFLAEENLGTYTTVATVSDRLAIRQAADFEIAWSFDRYVIEKFNNILDKFVRLSVKVGADELESVGALITRCVRGVREACKSIFDPTDEIMWNDLEVRRCWREVVQREVRRSGPSWLGWV